ncbi:aminoglycoside phosphotransferase family protein [Sessilibacter corallicola]|uniref:aminoglycoside phosphotransferase family protein n=1 Tax=Sessilibacter corallicola TaxID=2904075 RepID=UPI001E3CD369|nr:phosphotransferase [Sessilibacter corallicola]MCE2027558.1 phosphotransferase [Sessilibacter corallicola]
MTEPQPNIGPEFERWVHNAVANLSVLNDLTTQALSNLEITPLSGDAGFRQYHRVKVANLSFLAAAVPPTTTNTTIFSDISHSLNACGVSAPEILAIDNDKGWLLIEDFGDDLLFNIIQNQPEDVHSLYAQSAMTLLSIQQNRDYNLAIDSYSPKKLIEEMALFEQWFLPKLIGFSELDKWVAIRDELFPVLVANALAQPQVLVHRDYHCRNLIVRDGLPLAVIDFQDAVWGPVTYDVVSLLKDCYLRWQPEQVRTWALSYRNLAQDAGIIGEVSDEQFIRWLDLVGLQRHIKVLGIFARLFLRDGKSAYLHDLTRVLSYVIEVCEKYPETQAFGTFINDDLMPLISSQTWYDPDSATPIALDKIS